MGNMPSNYIAEMSQMDPISMEDLIAMNADWKQGQSKNFGILGSVSGITSVISSSTLIWMITRSHKGLSTTQHRILLGLSISDLISSVSISMFNSMAPSDDNYTVWNAGGNEVTCDAQGFLISFGTAGGLCYNAMLCLYYVTVAKYGKSEDYIRTKVEPFLHGIPILVALAYSIVGLLGNHFNDAGGGFGGAGSCIAPVYIQPHCKGYNVGDIRDGFEIPCYRGSEGADTFFIFVMVGLFIPAIIIIVSLIAIYKASLSQRSSSSTRSSKNMQSQSRAVMHRAFQYSAAWIMSYGMNILLVITNFQIVFIKYLTAIFGPLQGFFNLCIFMYPKTISARPRPPTSNLRDGSRNKNRPSRKNMKKNTNDDNTPHFFRHKHKSTTDKQKYDRREPQEEEEKCEIQPPSNMLVKVSQMMYAPNITHPCPVTSASTSTHPEIASRVQDVRKGAAASETSDHEGDVSEASGSGE